MDNEKNIEALKSLLLDNIKNEDCLMKIKSIQHGILIVLSQKEDRYIVAQIFNTGEVFIFATHFENEEYYIKKWDFMSRSKVYMFVKSTNLYMTHFQEGDFLNDIIIDTRKSKRKRRIKKIL